MGGQQHHLLALVTRGREFLPDGVEVRAPLDCLHPRIGRHRRARREQPHASSVQLGFGSCIGLHEVALIDRLQHQPPDRHVVERRIQMIEPDAADAAHAVLHVNGQLLVGAQHADKVDRRILPPVEFALGERRGRRCGIGLERPHHPVEMTMRGPARKLAVPSGRGT